MHEKRLIETCVAAPGGWCEVQYAYSLLGRKDLKPEARVSVTSALQTDVSANACAFSQTGS
jgi:hypothetical protein